MRARRSAWQAQGDAERVRGFLRLAEVVFDTRRLLIEQGLAFDKLAQRAVVCRQALLGEVVAEMLDKQRVDAVLMREVHQRRQLVQVGAHRHRHQTDPGQFTRRLAPSLDKAPQVAQHPIELGAHPDRLIGFGTGAIERYVEVAEPTQYA